MSQRPHFRAFCKHCEHTVRTAESPDFLDPFFLPPRCPGCNRFHNRSAYQFEDWNLYRVEYGFWRFVPAETQRRKVWWNPRTWRPAGTSIWTLWDMEPQQ